MTAYDDDADELGETCDFCGEDNIRCKCEHVQEIRFLQARLDRIQQFLKDQWSLIPICPLAQPGSYARGVQTGMSDVLAGLQRVLVWASHGGVDPNVDCPACNVGNPGVYVKDGQMVCPHRPERKQKGSI